MSFSRNPLSFAIFSILSTSIYAESITDTLDKNTPQTSVTLNTISLKAENENEVGKTIYTKEQLQNMPNGKKTIAEFLKTNTNVQFQRDALSSADQASLSPEKISINGAKFYDNKFIVNGVNTSNTLDPVGRADNYLYGAPSQAQTANINTDLLCELEVIDSNASAEHGDFMGGVISAKTCAPKSEIGKVHGTLSYDYTTDAWSRFNYVDQQEYDDSEEIPTTISTNKYHKEYVTQGISANLYTRLNEQFGINAIFSRRTSDLPLTSLFNPKKELDTQQKNENIGFTLYYTPSKNHNFQFGIENYQYDKNGFMTRSINSDYNLVTKTNTFRIGATHKLDRATIEQNLNYRSSEYQRQQAQDYYVLWTRLDGSKDWLDNSTSQFDGNVGGDIKTMQSSLNYDIKASFLPLQWGETQHTFKTGINYQHNKASLERESSYAQFTGRKMQNGLVCATGDILCTSVLNNNNIEGQYITSGQYYQAGKYDVRQDKGAIFLEDKINWKNFTGILGVRADYESLTSNLNIAPRSYFEYKPFSNELLKIGTGFNRYYGVTYLNTELDYTGYEGRGNLTRSTTNYNTNWDSENNYGWVYKANSNVGGVAPTDLNTPYSDEKLFAVGTQFNNIALGFKWVNREFNDQIRTSATTPRIFTNQYGGTADTYTISLSNITPFRFGNTRHKLNLGLSFVKQDTYTPSYSSTDTDNDKYVYLNGKVYVFGELPTKDAPFTARLNWLIEGTNLPWKLDNFFYYRSPTTYNMKTTEKITVGEHKDIAIYTAEKFSSKFNWDARLTYDWAIKKDQQLSFGITVNNILNKHNKATDSDGILYSEEGRRFIADITFKF